MNIKKKLLMLVAQLLTYLPYSNKLSILVDRLIIKAEKDKAKP